MSFPKKSVVSLYDDEGKILHRFGKGEAPDFRKHIVIIEGTASGRPVEFVIRVEDVEDGEIWCEDVLAQYYSNIEEALCEVGERFDLYRAEQDGLPKAASAWYKVYYS